MKCALQRLPCLVHPLVREMGCLFIPVAPTRPIFPSLVQVRCTVKSWCLAWRNKFVSCNEWAECQRNVFPQQPRELAGGQQQLACPAKGPAALVREKPVLVGMCSLSGVLLDKRAGSGYGVEKSQLEAVWKFGLGWECLYFLAEPQCYTSSCCRQSYLAGGVGSTGF